MLEQAFLEIPQGKELPIDSLAGQQARLFVTVFDQERTDLIVQDRGNESDRGLPHFFQIREGKASKRVAPVVEHLIEVMNARAWHFSSPLFCSGARPHHGEFSACRALTAWLLGELPLWCDAAGTVTALLESSERSSSCGL